MQIEALQSLILFCFSSGLFSLKWLTHMYYIIFYSLFKLKQETLSLKSIGYNKRKFRVGEQYIYPHEFAVLDPDGYFLRFSE